MPRTTEVHRFDAKAFARALRRAARAHHRYGAHVQAAGDVFSTKPPRWRKWVPLKWHGSKRGARLVLGWGYPLPACNVSVRLHWHCEREGEWPGIHLGAHLWRLEVYAGLGGLWWNEDAEDRSLFNISATVNTYGLRYVGCWFGHVPERREYPHTDHWYTSCKRCDGQLADGRLSNEAGFAKLDLLACILPTLLVLALVAAGIWLLSKGGHQ